MITANFNLEIVVMNPYYSKKAEDYTQTYDLNEIITVEGMVGPFNYELKSNTDVIVDGNTIALGPYCTGELIIGVTNNNDAAIAKTNVTEGYGKMNGFVENTLKAKEQFRQSWSIYIKDRNNNV